MNLLDNAIKFSDKNSEISITVEKYDNKGMKVSVGDLLEPGKTFDMFGNYPVLIGKIANGGKKDCAMGNIQLSIGEKAIPCSCEDEITILKRFLKDREKELFMPLWNDVENTLWRLNADLNSKWDISFLPIWMYLHTRLGRLF